MKEETDFSEIYDLIKYYKKKLAIMNELNFNIEDERVRKILEDIEPSDFEKIKSAIPKISNLKKLVECWEN